jgi:hypothetical protein
MPSVLDREGGLARIEAERGDERVLVGERVPAERDDVENQTLRRDAGLGRSRCERADRVVHEAAEELRYPASVAQRLALDQADEDLVVGEDGEEGVDIGVDRFCECAGPVLRPVGARDRGLGTGDGTGEHGVVERRLAAEEVRRGRTRDAGRVRDLLHARGVEPLPREQLLRRSEDRLPRARAVTDCHPHITS